MRQIMYELLEIRRHWRVGIITFWTGIFTAFYSGGTTRETCQTKSLSSHYLRAYSDNIHSTFPFTGCWQPYPSRVYFMHFHHCDIVFKEIKKIESYFKMSPNCFSRRLGSPFWREIEWIRIRDGRIQNLLSKNPARSLMAEFRVFNVKLWTSE